MRQIASDRAKECRVLGNAMPGSIAAIDRARDPEVVGHEMPLGTRKSDRSEARMSEATAIEWTGGANWENGRPSGERPPGRAA